MARFFPYSATSENRAMAFVDGENLAIFRRCFFPLPPLGTPQPGPAYLTLFPNTIRQLRSDSRRVLAAKASSFSQTAFPTYAPTTTFFRPVTSAFKLFLNSC